MTEYSTKIYLWPSSVLNTFVKRTPGLVYTPFALYPCFMLILLYNRLIWNKGTASEATLYKNGVNEAHVHQAHDIGY